MALASPAGPHIAVCIPPVATLELSRIPGTRQATWNVGDTAPVVFTQTSLEEN